MQATRGELESSKSDEPIWQRVRTSWATVSAVPGSYQNWLSLQSSETRATEDDGDNEESAVTELFCSVRNSLRAARA